MEEDRRASPRPHRLLRPQPLAAHREGAQAARGRRGAQEPVSQLRRAKARPHLPAKARGGPQVEIPTPFNMPAQVTVPGDATALAIPMPAALQGGWLGGGLPSGGPSLAGQWMQLPPPPMSAGVASRNPGQVALKRTRSGSRLVPSEEPAQPSAPPPLSVNVGVAINHNDVAAAAAARRGGGGAPHGCSGRTRPSSATSPTPISSRPAAVASSSCGPTRRATRPPPSRTSPPTTPRRRRCAVRRQGRTLSS